MGMSGTRRKICIITSAPISCNPRAVKEADALAAAGHDVRVVAAQHVTWVADWDRKLVKGRNWRFESVEWGDRNQSTKSNRFKSGIRQRVFLRLATILDFQRNIAERAYCRLYDELLSLARKESAELFIAHNPQALPIASRAAEFFGADLGFDSEDLHSGEFTSDEKSGLSYRLLDFLERKYLPKCKHITSPSNGVSRAIADRYGLALPTTIHNVFPLRDRQTIDGQFKDRKGSDLSLYWFSQIVGLNRGIQDLIQAASLLTKPTQIHLRGAIDDGVKRELLSIAERCGFKGKLYFHSAVTPDELLSRTAEHDIGFAIEQPTCENKMLTVSNKLFFYFLAGIAVAASDTIGQREAMESCPLAGFVYPAGDYKSLAAKIQQFLDQPDLLAKCKQASFDAATEQWNWEIESERFLNLVDPRIGSAAVEGALSSA
jgi:glycosyltransferase involved in cell wall biosynthesis